MCDTSTTDYSKFYLKCKEKHPGTPWQVLLYAMMQWAVWNLTNNWLFWVKEKHLRTISMLRCIFSDSHFSDSTRRLRLSCSLWTASWQSNADLLLCVSHAFLQWFLSSSSELANSLLMYAFIQVDFYTVIFFADRAVSAYSSGLRPMPANEYCLDEWHARSSPDFCYCGHCTWPRGRCRPDEECHSLN